MNKLRLVPTDDREAGGLIIFKLELWVRGEVVQTWLVNSGQPHAQKLLTYNSPESYSGDMRPIPEAVYRVGPLEFAGGKFDWVGSWGPGIGDFWASITPIQGETKRRAFGFHWDENRGHSPGSLGCVVFATRQDVESFVKAFRKHDPKELVVDYGFNTVPKLAAKPAPVAKPEPLEATLWINQNGAAVEISGKSYSVFSAGGGKNGGLKLKLVPR